MADLGEAFNTMKFNNKQFQTIDYFFTQKTIINYCLCRFYFAISHLIYQYPLKIRFSFMMIFVRYTSVSVGQLNRGDSLLHYDILIINNGC